MILSVYLEFVPNLVDRYAVFLTAKVGGGSCCLLVGPLGTVTKFCQLLQTESVVLVGHSVQRLKLAPC